MPNNGYVESFNSRMRDELLNETLFTPLAQARLATAIWRADYNSAASLPDRPSFKGQDHNAGTDLQSG